MKKHTLCFFAVAVVLTGAVFYYLDASKKTNTTDWLTYTEPERGFSFKYPPTYEIAQHGHDQSILAIVHADESLSNRQRAEIPLIRIWPPQRDVSYNEDADSLENYETDYKFQDKAYDGYSLRNVEVKPLPDNLPQVIIHSSERMNINGKPALKQQFSTGHWTNYGEFYSGNEYDENHSFRYVFFDGDDNFVIMRSYNPAAYLKTPKANKLAHEFEAFLDSIASTFIFTSSD